MSTFERLTPADRQRIGRKGGHARWATRPAPKPPVKTSSLSRLGQAIHDRKTYEQRKSAGLCVACGDRPAAPRIALEEPRDLPELTVLIWRQVKHGVRTSYDIGRALDRDPGVIIQRLGTLESHGWVRRDGMTQVPAVHKASATAVVWLPCTPPALRQTLCDQCISFRADYRVRMVERQELERAKLEEMRAAELRPFRRDVVVYEYGVRHEFVSIWDGKTPLLDAIQARA